MEKADESPSAFASRGLDAFPPLDSDNIDVRNFSDENKWPTQKLMGRLARYLEFLEREDPMPRAKKTANRIVDHLIFELSYKEGIYDERTE